MGNLELRRATFAQAFKTLEEILNMPFSVIVRDASIQRFEYTFEAAWKMLQVYLAEREGLVCNSPKGVFRAAGSSGLLSMDLVEQALEMTDDRNRTSHTYIEAVSQKIYGQLPRYRDVMGVLLQVC